MKLALFDLDHTVLDGDTNILWIDHLVENGLASPDTVARQQHYMALYEQQRLDMTEYMGFHIDVLVTRPVSEWRTIVAQFVQDKQLPRLAPEAMATLKAHREAGDRVALVSATNSVLVGGLAQVLGIHAISSDVEIEGDRLTGRIHGLPAFREHKITRVQDWIGMPLNDPRVVQSHFYSDSANDIPLLQAVSHPVTVNPDPTLQAMAQQQGWPVRTWKAAPVMA